MSISRNAVILLIWDFNVDTTDIAQYEQWEHQVKNGHSVAMTQERTALGSWPT
jgi:hypothetical protein